MALSTSANKVIHNGNGVATSFPFTFPILEASHLSVIYTDAGGNSITLSTSLYSVTGIGAIAGGSVTYPLSGSPLASGETLTLLRTVPLTQTTVLSNQGGYYPEVVERRFDLAYMAMQQLAEIVGRYTVSSISNPATEQSNYALIQALQSDLSDFDKLTTAGDVLTHNGANYLRLPRGTAGQFLGISGSALAWALPSYQPHGPRQCFNYGPVGSDGIANFFPATLPSLVMTTQNVSASFPLIASNANGSDIYGDANVVGLSTANLVFPAATINRAAATPNYAYVTVVAGALVTAYTLLPPVWSTGAAPSVTNDQFTFRIPEMRMYRGNGSSAVPWAAVFLGEVATDATQIISTVAYAYNGRYDSGWTATLNNTGFTKPCNLGAEPALYETRYVIQCTTIDLAYAVGDTLINGAFTSNVNSSMIIPYATRNTIGLPVLAQHVAIHKTSTALNVPLTAASWKYKLTANRGW